MRISNSSSWAHLGWANRRFCGPDCWPRLRRDDRHFLVMDIVRPQRHPLTGQHGLARSIHALRESLSLPEPALGTIKAGVGDSAQVRGWLVQAQRAATDRFLAEGPVAAPSGLTVTLNWPYYFVINNDLVGEARAN